MKGKCVSFSILSAWVALVTATAASAQDFARTGAYLGIGASVGFYSELDNTRGLDVDPGPGLNVLAGYRFHPNFAGEAEFEWISEADIDGGGVASNAEVDRTVIGTVNVKGYMLTGQFQPYGVLGLGGMNSEVEAGALSEDDTRFAARLGGGFDIYATENILGTIGATYVIPDDDLHDLAYVSLNIGIGYRF